MVPHYLSDKPACFNPCQHEGQLGQASNLRTAVDQIIRWGLIIWWLKIGSTPQIHQIRMIRHFNIFNTPPRQLAMSDEHGRVERWIHRVEAWHKKAPMVRIGSLTLADGMMLMLAFLGSLELEKTIKKTHSDSKSDHPWVIPQGNRPSKSPDSSLCVMRTKSLRVNLDGEPAGYGWMALIISYRSRINLEDR